MKIKIIGGGWYGCHIACHFIDKGHEVTVFEKRNELFGEASGANQSRLHLGFHYPRCAKTRQSCIEGASEFMREYGNLTQGVSVNIYAVAENQSLIDWETYRDTMSASGVGFLEVPPENYGLENLEGAMLTGERLILGNHAREMFKRRLSGHLALGEDGLSDNGDWDLTINCTYAAIPTGGVGRYEPVVIPIFEGRTDMAVTVMDGPMGASIYPWMADGYVSLTSVRDVRVAEVETYEEAREVADGITGEDIKRITQSMILAVKNYVPWFDDVWKFAGHSVTIRALPGSLADRRVCHVEKDMASGMIHVLPGKISNIFDAVRAIEEIIDEDHNR